METEAAGKIVELHSSNIEEDDVQCPTCDVKIKRSGMAEHYKLELERLQQQSSTTANDANDVAAASSNTSQNGIRQTRQSKIGEDRRRQPLTVFQRVQRNRQTRQKQRTRKRPTPSPPQQTAPSEAICPICFKSFPQSEIQVHANRCLRQIGQNSSDEDDDSDDATESDWRRQKRLRYEYTTMGHLVKYKPDQLRETEDDEDLNVDEDDTEIYGPAQYSETDVIPLASTAADGSGDVTNYMRRLISGDKTTSHSKDANASSSSDSSFKKNNASSTNPSTSTSLNPSPSTSSSASKLPIKSTTPVKPQSTDDNNVDEDISPDAVTASTSRKLLDKNQPKSIQFYEAVIESLKYKLKLFESEMQSKYKCLICLDDYKNPAISVSCWHVYCEQCWLRTLGARKLCPQCSTITTTKDLRRIYL